MAVQQSYTIKLEHFEGPLHLLLQLIEDEQLAITQISLAKVTDQFIEYVEASGQLNPEEVADFLVIAAKLLLIKSRIILPSLTMADEEATDLEKQLKVYKEYYQASKVIEQLIRKKRFTFSREKPLRVLTIKFGPPENCQPADLKNIFQEILKRIEPIVNLPQEVIRRTISISEKINQIKKLILEKMTFNFKQLLSNGHNKTEIIVSFLALLELVKQRTIRVNQNNIFTEIEIRKIEDE